MNSVRIIDPIVRRECLKSNPTRAGFSFHACAVLTNFLIREPGEVRAVLEVLKQIDVRVALSVIRTPTLVIHRVGDQAIRVGNGRFIARQIPGAKYVKLSGEDH